MSGIQPFQMGPAPTQDTLVKAFGDPELFERPTRDVIVEACSKLSIAPDLLALQQLLPSDSQTLVRFIDLALSLLTQSNSKQICPPQWVWITKIVSAIGRILEYPDQVGSAIADLPASEVPADDPSYSLVYEADTGEWLDLYGNWKFPLDFQGWETVRGEGEWGMEPGNTYPFFFPPSAESPPEDVFAFTGLQPQTGSGNQPAESGDCVSQGEDEDDDEAIEQSGYDDEAIEQSEYDDEAAEQSEYGDIQEFLRGTIRTIFEEMEQLEI
jgi:hypothetical protein